MSGYSTRFLIDGELQESSSDRTFTTENPATKEVLADVPVANEADVDAAVTAAKRAFETDWRHRDPAERADVLHRIATLYRENEDRLIDIEITNNGSTRQKLSNDAEKAAQRLEYHAGLTHEIKGESKEVAGNRISFVRREPFGVVASVIPFNHPLQFVASRLAPALVAGNTIVIKPSEYTPLSALEVARLIAEDDEIPDGVVNIVTGEGETGAHLTTHDDVRMVSMIGSKETGTKVMQNAAERIAPVLLELGGKNPSIVFPDADLETATEGCVGGMSLSWQGQSCSSGSRLVVHEDVHDEVVEGVVERFEALTVGSPEDDDSDTGAMVSRQHYEGVLEKIEAAKESDAELLAGGRPADVPGEDGYFIEPTVFDGVAPDSRLAQEEIFGPVLSVIQWSDYEEMIGIANGVEYGLTASVWTNNLKTAYETAKRLDAGYVWINEHGPKPIGTPFGGAKGSGIGRKNCIQDIHAHTELKTVNANLDTSDWEWD